MFILSLKETLLTVPCISFAAVAALLVILKKCQKPRVTHYPLLTIPLSIPHPYHFLWLVKDIKNWGKKTPCKVMT